jgi:hypothetical protein
VVLLPPLRSSYPAARVYKLVLEDEKRAAGAGQQRCGAFVCSK